MDVLEEIHRGLTGPNRQEVIDLMYALIRGLKAMERSQSPEEFEHWYEIVRTIADEEDEEDQDDD